MSETKKVVVPLDSSNKGLILQESTSASASSSASSLGLPEGYTDFYIDTKPVKPLNSDCCGSGCKVCVVDIFEKQLKEWEDMRNRKWLEIKENHRENNKNCLSETTFKKYTLKEISQETKDTFRYHFALVYSQTSNINAGQHITLRACINGKTIIRQYTPINLTRSNNSFELLIKIYPDGIMSKHLQTWEPGIEAEFRGPFGNFSMQLIAKFPKLVLLAAGTGIAPLSCIIESILQNEDDETFLHLLFACRQYKDILMKEELDDWLDFYNFSALCCLSQENPESVGFCKENLHFGRITKELLKTEITDFHNTYFLVCGSCSFNKDMLNFLLDLKITESQCFIF